MGVICGDLDVHATLHDIAQRTKGNLRCVIIQWCVVNSRTYVVG